MMCEGCGVDHDGTEEFVWRNFPGKIMVRTPVGSVRRKRVREEVETGIRESTRTERPGEGFSENKEACVTRRRATRNAWRPAYVGGRYVDSSVGALWTGLVAMIHAIRTERVEIGCQRIDLDCGWKKCWEGVVRGPGP